MSTRSSLINPVPIPARIANSAAGMGTLPTSREDTDNNAPISP